MSQLEQGGAGCLPPQDLTLFLPFFSSTESDQSAPGEESALGLIFLRALEFYFVNTEIYNPYFYVSGRNKTHSLSTRDSLAHPGPAAMTNPMARRAPVQHSPWQEPGPQGTVLQSSTHLGLATGEVFLCA